MNNNILGLILSIVYIGAIIALSNLFAQKSKEVSRKFIHIFLANWWLICSYYIDNLWFAISLPALFVVINYVSYKKNIIKSMERDDDQEKSPGTVYYAISLCIEVLFCYLFGFNKWICFAGIAVMGYGDGLAAVIGKWLDTKKVVFLKSTKSLAGSLTMLIVTGLIVGLTLYFLGAEYWIMKTIMIAIITTVAEAISVKGTDNLTVPILTTCMLLLCL
jgi:phytol kinase